MTRPISVSIVAWIIIVLNLLGVLMFARTSVLAHLTQGQTVYGFVGCGVAIVCGAFILAGKNWARWLYVVWCTVGLVYAFSTAPSSLPLLPGVIKTAIFVFVLFRKPANLFFSPAAEPATVGP